MTVLGPRRASLALVTYLPVFVAAYKEVTDSQCGCYYTNESSANYFATHRFYDFRSLSQYAKVPQPIDDPDDDSNASPTSNYFLSDQWSNDWSIQNWNNSASVQSGDAPILMVNSPNNVYIETNADEDPSSETYMTLRTFRQKHHQSAAEFQSVSASLHYLSVRMYARTVGPPGAVTAMFTYKDDGDPNDLKQVQESDLEIRTQDPVDKIQYTNQPSYSAQGDDVPAATRNATTPASVDRTKWAVYRTDWDPSATTWYIDGQNVASISFQVPRDPSAVIFNAWSDGGVWSGKMSAGSTAYLQIQWIEIVYNSTNTATKPTRSGTKPQPDVRQRDAPSCSRVCSIDETSNVGTPVLIQGTAPRLASGIISALISVPLTLAVLSFL